MAEALPLWEVNPSLDTTALAAEWHARGRARVPRLLTERSADVLHDVLETKTPWGLAWQAGRDGPHTLRAAELTAAKRQTMGRAVGTAMAGDDYAFCFAQYPMLMAYQERWAPGGPHDLLLEHLNDRPFLDLARAITGLPELVKADAQATLFGPGHFLSTHDDTGEDAEGRRVAYVLSMCAADWRPDWGGQLLFLDNSDDVEAGWRPRFNTLSLFAVPCRHMVSAVAPYARLARYAITGWLRDR